MRLSAVECNMNLDQEFQRRLRGLWNNGAVLETVGFPKKKLPRVIFSVDFAIRKDRYPGIMLEKNNIFNDDKKECPLAHSCRVYLRSNLTAIIKR